MKKVIFSSKVPAPIGPYSQGLLVGDTLYISGQIAMDPATNKLVKTNIKEETKMVMEHLRSVLEEANMNFDNVYTRTNLLNPEKDNIYTMKVSLVKW